MDLIVISGGLGLIVDDMIVEVVVCYCGCELVLDDELENRIVNIFKKLMG